MSVITDGLIYAWNKNQDYGCRLVADLSDSQMVFQPVSDGAPANHPAWILSHLNVYLPIIAKVIQGHEFEDPISHQFGMQSKPLADAAVYESKVSLVEAFENGHQRVAELLAQYGDAALAQPVLLPRWQAIMPSSAFALPYLMFNHENMHLGQLSAWRRVQGLPSV